MRLANACLKDPAKAQRVAGTSLREALSRITSNTTRMVSLDGPDFETVVQLVEAGASPIGAISELQSEQLIERTRQSMQPSAEPDGSRSVVVQRNACKRQWALHVRPAPDFPVAESVFFAPLPEAVDAALLTLSHDEVREYLIEHRDEWPVEDIDIRADLKDFSSLSARLWSNAFKANMRGWTRTGLECGLEQAEASA